MPIHEDCSELTSITKELERLRVMMRDLNRRKRDCESRILTYMQENNHPGLRMGDVVVTMHESQRVKRQPQRAKLNRVEQVLQEHGVDNAGAITRELIDSLRGSPRQTQVLKLKKVK